MKRFLLALILTAFACLHAQQPPADEPTRILAYNVEIGFNNAAKLLETAEWIRSYDPEVILFQEIARQDSKGFAEMARLWGHSYAAVAKPFTDYSIALTSRHPFEIIETRTADLHHGYVLAKINGVYFMSIHTSPFDFSRRIQETAIYARRIKPLLDAGEKLIMMGDFNNYSPLDKERFDGRLEKMDPVKRENYIKGRGKNMNNGKYDYVSTQQLLDIGLLDVGFDWMKEHNIIYWSRIDLALLSPNLKDDVVESYVEFPKAKFFSQLSDHYPNLLKLRNLNFPKAPAPLPLPPEPEPEVVPGAINLVTNGSFDNGLDGWKKEIRTADLGSVEVVDGAAKIPRLPKATFGRIFQDLSVRTKNGVNRRASHTNSLGVQAFGNRANIRSKRRTTSTTCGLISASTGMTSVANLKYPICWTMSSSVLRRKRKSPMRRCRRPNSAPPGSRPTTGGTKTASPSATWMSPPTPT